MTNTIRYSFCSDAFASDSFDIIGYFAVEALSSLFKYELELRFDKSARDKTDIDALVQSSCSITVNYGNNAESRSIFGKVTAIEELAYYADYSVIKAVVEPRLSVLKNNCRSKVYLNLSLPGLVKEIFSRYNFKEDSDYKLLLSENYRVRPFTLQYEETDFNFLARLLEYEGVTFYFAHLSNSAINNPGSVAGLDQLIITDTPSIHAKSIASTVSMLNADTLKNSQNPGFISMFKRNISRLPKRVLVSDYNDDSPQLDILAEYLVPEGSEGDVNVRLNYLPDIDEAIRAARVHAERLYCQGRFYDAYGMTPSLQSGGLLTLNNHANEQLNSHYLITRIHTTAFNPNCHVPHFKSAFHAEKGLYTQLQCTSTRVEFRPTVSTDKPLIKGAVDAVIDSSTSGQYADLDEQGRYLIRFPFEYSVVNPAIMNNYRVRMTQIFSGAQEGAHFPVRKGTHVLVSFIKGDPDQPIITGAVTNAVHSSVVRAVNSSRSVISTQSGNTIEFEDQRGRERINLSVDTIARHAAIGIGETHDGLSGLQMTVSGLMAKSVMGSSIEWHKASNDNTNTEDEAGFVFNEITLSPTDFGVPTGANFTPSDQAFIDANNYAVSGSENTAAYFYTNLPRFFFLGEKNIGVTYGRSVSYTHEDYAGYQFADGKSLYHYFSNTGNNNGDSNSLQPLPVHIKETESLNEYLNSANTSVGKYNSVSVKQGVDISFGGSRSYNFGPRYSESHIEFTPQRAHDVIGNKALLHKSDRHINDVITSLEARDPEYAAKVFAISKTLGDSYSYTSGTVLSQSLGRRESSDFTNSVNIRYHPTTNIKLSRNEDHGDVVTTYRYHPAHGAPITFERSMENGLVNFKNTYVPTFSANVKLGLDTNVDIHSAPNINIMLSHVSNLNCSVQGIDCSVTEKALDISVNTGLLKIFLDSWGNKLEITKSGFKSANEAAKLEVEKAAQIEKLFTTVREQATSLEQIERDIRKRDIYISLDRLDIRNIQTSLTRIEDIHIHM